MSGVSTNAGNGPHARLMFGVRHVLPALVIVAGLVFFFINPTVDNMDGPAAIIGAGLSIWLLNALFRVGVSGERDRDAEDAARAYFDAHGRWPDDEIDQGQTDRTRGDQHDLGAPRAGMGDR